MHPSVGRKIAIVVPRFGKEVHGGAEKLALAFATHLSALYDVDVLTTCARDYRTWENVYDTGETQIDGFTVRRFSVERPRNISRFDKLSASLHERLQNLTVSEQDEWVREQGPYSTSLLEYLAQHADRYSAVLFLPYLYATTYFGLPLVAERTILVPLAHDEWPIYMPAWNAIFASAVRVVFVTEEERDFVRRRFAPQSIDGPVTLCGIDALPGDASRFRRKFGVNRPFALYVGRVDESKGCQDLLDAFTPLREGGAFNLVLAGPLHMRVRNQPGVILTGEVDEQTKWDAMAACDLFVMPSRYESLSFAVLEAWSCSKPVLVSAHSKVLVAHCRKSNGGLWYSNPGEFSAAFGAIAGAAGPVLGAQGREYVQKHFIWSRSIAVLRDAIEVVGNAGLGLEKC